MLLFKDLNVDNFKFKPARKTDTGSRIIDSNGEMYQTSWMKVLYDVEFSICVSTEGIEKILEDIDEKIINQSIISLDFSEDDIVDMYKPLKKNYLSLPISTSTVLFDKDKNYYKKSDIKNIVKANSYIRCIIRFKKIYYKDHEITFPIEVVQIEI